MKIRKDSEAYKKGLRYTPNLDTLFPEQISIIKRNKETNIREQYVNKTGLNYLTPDHGLGEMCTGCASFTDDYVQYLEQQNDAKDKVIEVLLKRLKKYHNENKEPEVLELMDIIEAENILEASQ